MSRLERILASLPETVEWPEPSEQLATRVVAHIESDRPRSRRSRWAIAAASATLILVVGLVPDSRQALADMFHEAGVRIGFLEETPTDLTDELDLGSPVTLEAAATQVDFELRSPTLLGPPDEVYLDDGVVSMVWSGPVLLTQRETGEPFGQKRVTPDTQATGVAVGGEPGLWIEGAEHEFTLLDDDGDPIQETARLAANVLLWSANSIDYRLELTGDLDRALEVATSLEGTG